MFVIYFLPKNAFAFFLSRSGWRSLFCNFVGAGPCACPDVGQYFYSDNGQPQGVAPTGRNPTYASNQLMED
jgi:hypothetical protein